METQIVTRVAEILRNPSAKRKGPLDKTSEAKDSVEVSTEAAKRLQDLQAQPTDYDKERMMKVQRIEAQVDAKSYRLNDSMVDSIADKIIEVL